MPIAQILQSLKGTCRFCRLQAGLLQRDHPSASGPTRPAGRRWSNSPPRPPAPTPSTRPPSGRPSGPSPTRSRATTEDIDRALEEGFRQGVAQAMADGIITRDEEERLRAFRDRLALENSAADQGALAELDRAGADRVVMEARLAAISVRDGDGHLQDLALSIRQAGLGQSEANRLLIRAWETAVQGALEDGLLSLDEENALARYADHFSLTQQALDQNGVHTSLVQAAVLRDVAQGIVPKRQRVNGAVPFNLMKSEQLVWVIQGVDYLETVVRRERRGSSQGLSIRVARGLYYRPSTFRSRPIEWEETVHADTGMLGLTTKHIYFAGSRKRFRVRYDRIVAFEPFSDGFGIMRDAQTARPQTFRTGDGWFAYNLAANLA